MIAALERTERISRTLPPTALVLASILSIQLGAVLAEQLFDTVGVPGAASLRVALAGLAACALWRPPWRIDRRALPAVLGLGASFALMNLTFYAALDRIPLSIAMTIAALGPLAVALSGSRRRDITWVLLAAAGVVLLTKTGGPVAWTGVLFAVLNGACWAGYIILSKRVGERTRGTDGLAQAMVIGALLVLPVGLPRAGTMILDPIVLVVGIGVAVLSSLVPYAVELEALRRMPPRVFGVLMSLDPAAAAVAGLVLLGETLEVTQWLGVGLVVVASIGVTRSENHAIAPSPQAMPTSKAPTPDPTRTSPAVTARAEEP